uniref:uncharacterized protein isoform X2 n=1 Tax=Pristiophorus japonicus TaxID=55135 RepID=UPI00398F51C1
MHQEITEENVELEKSVRRLREKFHTKGIPITTAVSLMRRYNNDYDLVSQEILRLKDLEDDAEDAEVANNPENWNAPVNNEEISNPGSEDDDDRDLQGIADRLKRLPLTQENLQMFDLAMRGEIPCDQRQFACLTCDRDWWREVPERKLGLWADGAPCSVLQVQEHRPAHPDHSAQKTSEETGNGIGAPERTQLLRRGLLQQARASRSWHALRPPTDPGCPRPTQGTAAQPEPRVDRIHRGQLCLPGLPHGVRRGQNHPGGSERGKRRPMNGVSRSWQRSLARPGRGLDPL